MGVADAFHNRVNQMAAIMVGSYVEEDGLGVFGQRRQLTV